MSHINRNCHDKSLYSPGVLACEQEPVTAGNTSAFAGYGVWIARKKQVDFIPFFTITSEIHARSLANFYCQYADRHKLKIHATRQRARAGNSTICYRKKTN